MINQKNASRKDKEWIEKWKTDFERYAKRYKRYFKRTGNKIALTAKEAEEDV